MIDPHDRPTLGNETLRLRAPVAADVDARLALGAHSDILHMFGAPLVPVQTYSRAMAQAWVDQHLQDPLAFAIERDAHLVGGLRLHSLDAHDRRASLAIALLHPDLLGQGIGTAAMRLILDHAFGAMALNRVALRVIDYNHRAIAAYEKLGFVQEGRERQAARVADAYHDDIIMGLLASEWSQ